MAGIVVGVLALCVLAWVLHTFDPEQVTFYPRCPSHWLLGIECPGCGTARGLHALLNGNIARAWHYNAALFFALPFTVFYLVAIHRPPASRLYRAAYSPWTPGLLAVASVLWTIGRNIL